MASVEVGGGIFTIFLMVIIAILVHTYGHVSYWSMITGVGIVCAGLIGLGLFIIGIFVLVNILLE